MSNVNNTKPKLEALMDSFVCVPLDQDLYQEILKRHGSRANSVIDNVIWDFLDRTKDDFQDGASHISGGVQWDRLYLPNGTRIQTTYFKEPIEAQVTDGKLVWNGEQYPSVSKLINAMRGGTQNNAWITAQIMRPSDSKFIPADKLRPR